MKKNAFLLCILISLVGCNQKNVVSDNDTDKKTAEAPKTNADSISSKTKMEHFVSKTGTILKFTDYSLPKLKTEYSTAATSVRKLISGTDTVYFYQIEISGNYSTKKAAIEYSDLLEVLKALSVLKSQSVNDLKSDGDYLENKFITVDGFQLGYYIGEKKVTRWYLKLDRYGSDNTLYTDKLDEIETALIAGKNKIEELKK